MLSSCLASAARRGKVSAWRPLASPRRIGAEDSKTRAQLLDAAEQLLLEEGYAAVTSRRVAAKAGLKPQLVHYYFRTMDDLFLEVFRRRAEENLARFERAVADDGSLRDAVAAQRRPARRRLHRSSSSRWPTTARRSGPRSPATPSASAPPSSRRSTTALGAAGIAEDELPPIVALLLMTGVSQVLGSSGASASRPATTPRSPSWRTSWTAMETTFSATDILLL